MGPAVTSLEKILQLIDAGMNVARINFSHGTQEEHAKVIQTLKKAREIRKASLAIMLDTKGPEIRVGLVKGGQISLTASQKLLLVRNQIEGDEKQIQVTPGIALDKLALGDKVLFDDGYIISFVKEITSDGVIVEIQNSGILKSQKGVNIPEVNVELPAMTLQDISDISFGCKEDVDLIAASFIRSAEHVLEIKKLLAEQKKPEILVIAKIENRLGVKNFDSIIQVADGIMVARGDLGVELPLQEVPKLQKTMIRKCYQASKPVVTATQMLESMIKNPRPTRAEVSDVANAIYDSTSAVMLSGETAVGAYPIETVETMRSIIVEAERDFNYREFFNQEGRTDYNDVSFSVSLAAVKTAYSANAQAIFAFTNSGFTARLISRFRPEMPIIALTSNPKVYNQLALNWGVIAADPTPAENVQEAFSITSCFALQQGLAHYGDLVVITAGSPFGITGSTNSMLVESIGDVIVRGHPNPGKKVHGKVSLLLLPDETRAIKGKIIVINHCNESYRPFFKNALGVVLQNRPQDTESEAFATFFAKEFDIPILLRADSAMNLLRENQLVTLDPERGIVYKGTLTPEDHFSQVCKK